VEGGEIKTSCKIVCAQINRRFNNGFFCLLESISPTFYKRICANILAPKKSLTFTASTKKLRAKLSYEKAVRKMLVFVKVDMAWPDFSDPSVQIQSLKIMRTAK
jgi:hypothetical protein